MDYHHIIHVVEKKWVFSGVISPYFWRVLSPFIIGFWAYFATKQNVYFGWGQQNSARMVNWWFGAWWFGIRIGLSLSSNPFHKEIQNDGCAYCDEHLWGACINDQQRVPTKRWQLSANQFEVNQKKWWFEHLGFDTIHLERPEKKDHPFGCLGDFVGDEILPN